ncbi:MAG: DUF937 domain-containing protein [Hyphomicrobium sp.]
MSTNLVASAAKLLTPELVSRLASALGIDQTMVEKALNAGIPGLLAAFISMVGRPGGATKLADAVAQQQPGVLSSIASAGPGGERDIINQGLGSLSSLLGGSTVSAITQALNRYAGIGEAGSKGVLGLLAPLVLGVLGQQQRGAGLDASGFAQLLQSQASNVARALPSGFAKQLSDTGILDQMPSVASMSRTRDRSASEWSWVMPALAVVALGALAWYLFGRPNEQNVATAPPAAVETPMQVPRDIIVTEAEEKDWVGRPIFSRDNQKVGEIIEIKRGPDNRLTDIYFDAGTFLGMGAKRYHITSDQIQEAKPNGLVVTLKESEIEAMPQSPEQAKQ